jgi:broad specificity phosphatase PhoE
MVEQPYEGTLAAARRPRPTVYYIRHGQTDWNAELRFQGRQDIPLNSNGRAQAEANGRKLKRLVSDLSQLDFVTSPLCRARETMEIVRRALSLDAVGYRIEPRLIEASYGKLEGVTLAEFKAQNEKMHKMRKKMRWSFQPEGGESHEMVYRRIVNWIDALDQDTLIVGHGVVGRVVRMHLNRIEPEAAASFTFPQDRIFIWNSAGEKRV